LAREIKSEVTMGKNQGNPGFQLEATEENSQTTPRRFKLPTSPASLETPGSYVGQAAKGTKSAKKTAKGHELARINPKGKRPTGDVHR
jgi:hypothetical protein